MFDYALQVLEKGETEQGAHYHAVVTFRGAPVLCVLQQPGLEPAVWDVETGDLVTGDGYRRALGVVLAAALAAPGATPAAAGPNAQQAWVEGLQVGFAEAWAYDGPVVETERVRWLKSLVWPDVARQAAQTRTAIQS